MLSPKQLQRVLILHPGTSRALSVRIDANDFRNVQALVGGTIASSSLTDRIAAMYHDEGLLIGLAPNRIMPNGGALLVGTIVFVANDDDGEAIDLTNDDEAYIARTIATWESAGHFSYTFPDPIVASSYADLEAKQAERRAAGRNTYGVSFTLSPALRLER